MAVKRMGANSQKAAAEQRARRPQRVKKIAKAVFAVSFVCAAGFAAYTHSDTITDGVTSAFKASRRTYADFEIANCGAQVGVRLKNALDSLVKADPSHVDRAEVIRAAAMIPEIEKIKIGKTRDKSTLIKVTERKPVAITYGGDVSLVDRNGIRFPASSGQYYDLPIVNFGGHAADTVPLETFNAIKKASRDLGADFFSQISQIDLSEDVAVSLIFKSGKTEFILPSDDIEVRLTHVKKLTERLSEQGEEPTRVDLRYRNLAYSSM